MSGIKLGQTVGIEFHTQDGIRVNEFTDGRFTMGFWLPEWFRVSEVQLRNHSDMSGVSLQVGTESEPDRFGSVTVDSAVRVLSLGEPAGTRILSEKLRPVVSVSGTNPDSERAGEFDIRFYGYKVD